jgi:hypothetical protein
MILFQLPLYTCGFYVAFNSVVCFGVWLLTSSYGVGFDVGFPSNHPVAGTLLVGAILFSLWLASFAPAWSIVARNIRRRFPE